MTPKHFGLRVIRTLPHCPSCGVELKAYSGAVLTPKPGNLSICDQCFGLNVFISSETLEQRIATDPEVEEHVKALRERNEHGMAALIEQCLARRRKGPRA